jgi:hypothetical protein
MTNEVLTYVATVNVNRFCLPIKAVFDGLQVLLSMQTTQRDDKQESYVSFPFGSV